MNEIDKFALKIERQIAKNEETLASLPEFEKRKSRPLGNGVSL
jgi:hypothetical protein